MGPQAGHLVSGARPLARDASDYRRLLAVLASRAKRQGSRDAEGAAQETLKRALENAGSRPAVEYYFSDVPPALAEPPEWPLDRLFAWLHAALHYVVREEQSRAAYRRELPAGVNGVTDPADPAPDPLDTLIQMEMEAIVADCFSRLDRQHRTVLRMRVDGLKYNEIATRLGVNENTVATWVSRGIRELARFVRKRGVRR